jgi:nicotinate-nucleotide adenylyltransferase
MVLMRIGIYGGSFDPVHFGHLLLAESAREQLQLDTVVFMPAGIAPHKQQDKTTSPAARLDMLKLAIGGQSAFEVSDLEIKRGGISYTADTLTELREQHADAELILLVGADTLVDMPNWKDPERIVSLANIGVVERTGSQVETHSLPGAEILRVTMPRIDLSSRQMRTKVEHRKSIRYCTPRAVEKYIEAAGLYQDKPANA